MRQLIRIPDGNSILELRDCAILKLYLATGARFATACTPRAYDFHQAGDETTLCFRVKGGRIKTKRIRFSAAESIAECIKAADWRAVPSSALASCTTAMTSLLGGWVHHRTIV